MLSISHPNFMAIGLTVTKPSAYKCRSLCKLISNSMYANLGQTNERIAMKLRYHRREWVLQSCLKRFGEDWSCHHRQISRGLAKERATSHKH